MFNTKKPITPVMTTEKTNGNGGGNGTTLINVPKEEIIGN